jgi:hypothetical protein
MPLPPPEPIAEKTTPQAVLARLEKIRQTYARGLLPATQFNEMLAVFQFVDDLGHLWAPGAQSNRWYRWDRTEWTPAEPPATLSLADPKLSASPDWFLADSGRAAPPQAPPAPAGGIGGNPGLAIPPAPAWSSPPPPQAPLPAGRICSNPTCRKPVAPGKKFCSSCGTPL